MKVKEIAPFSFCFKSNCDVKNIHQMLIDFLKSNGWLNDAGDGIASLSSYNSNADGTCHILLANDTLSEEFMKLTKRMFENLVSDKDIEWIKVGYHPSTESIIYNNIDKYSRCQSIPIQEMSVGDMMVVFKR